MGGMIESVPMMLLGKQAQSRELAERQAEQNQLLATQQQQRERQQRDLLARQLATARARLAAGGTGMSGGSGVALLEGIARDAERDIADDAATTRLRQNMSISGGGSAGALQDGLSLYHGISTLIGK